MTEELDNFLKKRKRRNGVQLLLTPLIDIFTLLIIFIVKGMVFSQSDLILPRDVILPQSQTQESLDNTPKLIVSKDKIQWGPDKKEYPLAIVQEEFELHPLRQQLAQQLNDYFEKGKVVVPQKLRTVQIIADRENPYDVIFKVSQFLQRAGVARVVYVTIGLP